MAPFSLGRPKWGGSHLGHRGPWGVGRPRRASSSLGLRLEGEGNPRRSLRGFPSSKLALPLPTIYRGGGATLIQVRLNLPLGCPSLSL